MTPARILIVEDERITAEYLQAVLLELGYSVTGVASTGADAIREAGRANPDLVMMDIRIKGEMDGIETARVIRERFDIPSIYLTAHADAETLSRAKLAEPLGYLVKPFQELEIQASVEMAMHKRQIDRESARREERLSATLSAMGEGVIWTDREGTITFINAAAQEWTGVSEGESVGRPIGQVLRLGPESADEVLARVLASKDLSGFAAGDILETQAGTRRPIGGSAAPFWDHRGELAGSVFVFGEVASNAAAASASASAGASPPPNGKAFPMVAESPSMKRLVNFAQRVSRSEAATILIEGESGTGKDVIARFLHFHSNRRAEPFLAINCAAIPETLLESELFGYEKGAFTDARQQKRGILELATGGTVFLDEVGEMPLGIQAKLLRVLEHQAFRRLGGAKDIDVDLRIITATNRDLRNAIRENRFRLDLYYRINVIRLVIPPLRERPEDILPLANYFLQQLNSRFKRRVQSISAEAAGVLQAYEWPGNARELRNVLERALILEDGPSIRPENLDFPKDTLLVPAPPHAAVPHDASALPAASMAEGVSLGEAERTMLARALEKSNWNQTRAAKVLGITRDTLRYKMKKHGLTTRPVNPGVAEV